jgi:hypothetical protein
VIVTEQWVNQHWPRLVADADLTLDHTQLIVVKGERPNGGAEAAYVPPTFDRPLDAPKVYSGIQRIGNRAYKLHHVIVVWEELPDRDEVAVEALFRHELEHAKQWELWGRSVVDELDDVLKVVGGDAAYHETPIERGADAAARSWVAREHGQAEADRLAATVFPHWLDVPDGAAAADLRTDTIAMLRDRAPAAYLVEMSGGDPPMPLDDFIREHEAPHNPLHASAREDAPEIEFVE